jgi:hypothetical protein
MASKQSYELVDLFKRAAGVPAMWAVPNNCAEDRVLQCARWRLQFWIDVLAPENVRTLCQENWLPSAHRKLPSRA